MDPRRSSRRRELYRRTAAAGVPVGFPDGSIVDKGGILAHARVNGKRVAEMEQLVAHYRKTHLFRTDVVITGNTALLTFYLKKTGVRSRVMSCDMFVYTGGRCRGTVLATYGRLKIEHDAFPEARYREDFG